MSAEAIIVSPNITEFHFPDTDERNCQLKPDCIIHFIKGQGGKVLAITVVDKALAERTVLDHNSLADVFNIARSDGTDPVALEKLAGSGLGVIGLDELPTSIQESFSSLILRGQINSVRQDLVNLAK